MKYAEVDNDGNIVRVFTQEVPLQDGQIPRLKNGRAKIRPIVVQLPTLAAGQRIAEGPSLVVTDSVVNEVYDVEPIPVIPPDALALQARQHALPKREYELEVLWRIVAKCVARGSVTLSAQEQQVMTNVMTIRANNPVQP